MKRIQLFILISFLISTQAFPQNMEVLRKKIQQIVTSKNAVVGVAINGMDQKDSLTISNKRHYPMQSVFKFHIALNMLAEIDKGNFSLDQKIEFKKSHLLPELWSPISKKYPEGTTLTIAEIIEYTVTMSDNAGCDRLIELLGSPQIIEGYFRDLGFTNIAVKINEKTMQSNWDLQFQNWITPSESNAILKAFYANEDNLLSQKSHDFIWQMMKTTQTGKKRLRGQLPKETMVAHKTGWSGTHKTTGITAAVNNIGIVFLPDGSHFFISVFVTDSAEDFETNEKIISDIAAATWGHFANKN